ncbi:MULTISPECIES: WXG100 family type VII secretion target [Nonomuraea]|uniref:WXG100 family type VII secretion target n=1 Tax=Nonomuraea TaxID=83681 RepID=UPI001CDA11C1|nr:WXG100 family type VII secretion target [Nonomuraea aurantiaca]MCA2224280.1 WXG100 family type VII secretion target [Nonomuraea aurantiaca]
MATLMGTAPTKLIKAAGQCETTAQYIEGMRQRVQTIKGDLMAAGWKGGASQQFGKALDAWDVDFQQVIKILESIYDKLNMGAGVYSTAAQQNMDISSGLNSAGAGGRIDSLINASS